MSGPRGGRERPDGGDDRLFAVECPSCREHVAVTRALVGRAALCPKCRRAFLVPAAVANAAPAATPAAAPGATSAVAPAERPEAPIATIVSRHEPLVFAEPPVPSTRRRREEPPAEVSATPATAPPADASAASRDDALAAEAASSAFAGAVAYPEDPALEFREPVKTVRVGGAEIELRQLTAEEKRVRRARRNVVILVVGAAILVALVAMLGTRGR